jgi:hypothetical protein
MRKTLRPGQRAPRSGQYHVVGTRREVTSVKGEPLPPGPKGSRPRYRLVDKTVHKQK